MYTGRPKTATLKSSIGSNSLEGKGQLLRFGGLTTTPQLKVRLGKGGATIAVRALPGPLLQP